MIPGGATHTSQTSHPLLHLAFNMSYHAQVPVQYDGKPGYTVQYPQQGSRSYQYHPGPSHRGRPGPSYDTYDYSRGPAPRTAKPCILKSALKHVSNCFRADTGSRTVQYRDQRRSDQPQHRDYYDARAHRSRRPHSHDVGSRSRNHASQKRADKDREERKRKEKEEEEKRRRAKEEDKRREEKEREKKRREAKRREEELEDKKMDRMVDRWFERQAEKERAEQKRRQKEEDDRRRKEKDDDRRHKEKEEGRRRREQQHISAPAAAPPIPPRRPQPPAAYDPYAGFEPMEIVTPVYTRKRPHGAYPPQMHAAVPVPWNGYY